MEIPNKNKESETKHEARLKPTLKLSIPKSPARLQKHVPDGHQLNPTIGFDDEEFSFFPSSNEGLPGSGSAIPLLSPVALSYPPGPLEGKKEDGGSTEHSEYGEKGLANKNNTLRDSPSMSMFFQSQCVIANQAQ